MQALLILSLCATSLGGTGALTALYYYFSKPSREPALISKTGRARRDAQRAARWQVDASAPFAAAAAFVRAHGGPDLLATARLQLGTDPFDATRKRVVRTGDRSGTLSLRMFRIDFTADAATRTIALTALRSGYTPDELALPEDPYADKVLHRAFTAT